MQDDLINDAAKTVQDALVDAGAKIDELTQKIDGIAEGATAAEQKTLKTSLKQAANDIKKMLNAAEEKIRPYSDKLEAGFDKGLVKVLDDTEKLIARAKNYVKTHSKAFEEKKD